MRFAASGHDLFRETIPTKLIILLSEKCLVLVDGVSIAAGLVCLGGLSDFSYNSVQMWTHLWSYDFLVLLRFSFDFDMKFLFLFSSGFVVVDNRP